MTEVQLRKPDRHACVRHNNATWITGLVRAELFHDAWPSLHTALAGRWHDSSRVTEWGHFVLMVRCPGSEAAGEGPHELDLRGEYRLVEKARQHAHA